MSTHARPATDLPRFSEAHDALAHLQTLYRQQIRVLRDAMQQYVASQDTDGYPPVRAYYPLLRIEAQQVRRPQTQLAYGFLDASGTFETTITRPDLFHDYLLLQLQLLQDNHGVQFQVGLSQQPIPIHFSFAENDHVEGQLSARQRQRMREVFDLPDLSAMDDGIANGTWQPPAHGAMPLALFTAPRIDYSLHRLRHYTGTAPEWFQHFVLFTNYQFYVDEFIRLGLAEMAKPDSPYIAFVQPGNMVTHRVGLHTTATDAQGKPPASLPQMPGYHLVRADHHGISLVNIGVGPANAKTITDHIAVLRPHAWMMLGHCAGLRNSQQLGDYVLAHAYVREDHVLDEELPLWVPIPALAEIQQALQQATADITAMDGSDLKTIMRTGTVASTDNRNWELLPDNLPQRRFSQSRAIALDMESATIAANGFRFRVPYGTLLCVSDKPLHGEIKLPGMANHFYRERVQQHLLIGMRAIDILREGGVHRLHSRKLRSFAEVAFQ